MTLISCHLNFLPNIGSSFFQYYSTISYCTITYPAEMMHRTENIAKSSIDVRWHDENLQHKASVSSHFQSILKSFIEKVVLPYDSNKHVLFRFNIINESQFALMCAVNSCLLAMLDIGIPICGLFYADGNNESVRVFMNEEIIFTSMQGNEEFEGGVIENVKKAVNECIKKNLKQDIFK